MLPLGSENLQEDVNALTSTAAAPMTAKVTDSRYVVPLGQVHGVTESFEQAGSGFVRTEEIMEAKVAN